MLKLSLKLRFFAHDVVPKFTLQQHSKHFPIPRAAPQGGPGGPWPPHFEKPGGQRGGQGGQRFGGARGGQDDGARGAIAEK